MGQALLPPGTPVDLSNCEREPIHVPGSVQPRGVLLSLREPDLVVQQASANLREVSALDAAAAVGRPLGDVLGAAAAGEVTRFVSRFGELRERNPLELLLPGPDGSPLAVDAVLHRAPGGALVVELELASGPRPFSFPNTYQAVRGAVAELNRTTSLRALYQVAAEAVRGLTGFDRVMVYRYDADWNGEVVAEAKRADLNPFLGLHYPASDIPAQARALYEKNWIRLIDDVGYAPVPVLPADDPVTGAPLDLTYSTLRSVSPIHLEYLQNMGVRASMSISLLREDRLWGLIACHHYSGPLAPPYGVRAAAEFLGSALSLRLVDRAADEEARAGIAARSRLAALTARTLDESVPLAQVLVREPGLLDLVPAAGAVAVLQGAVATAGDAPPPDVVRAVARWAAGRGEDVVATDSLERDAPGLLPQPSPAATGVLAVPLSGEQCLLWFRPETVRRVDWGGDPHNKALAEQEGDHVRLSPRKSFERWRETVRGRSEPWTDAERDVAAELRVNVLEALYERSRRLARVAATLQHSLLPADLPRVGDWELYARYAPMAGGQVGGDWYDALRLPDGRLAVVLGDVAGHGLAAAGTMGQLRNALRAYLVEDGAPGRALARLDVLLQWLLPEATATAAVAVVDPATGLARVASAGHPPPLLISPDGVPQVLEVASAPLLGAPLPAGPGAVPETEVPLQWGSGLALYSDGLVERRGEPFDTGLARLVGALVDVRDGRVAGDAGEAVFERSRDPQNEDDATLIVVARRDRRTRRRP
ncbi:GAF domain-containing protein [Vallicoccus soli]|uniref:GAF domain-containing protein n=1 Tax=Vallicoccus soli TaxID=2339232 RepID=A0A3A3ZFF7_9ACTN|nr:GAF domain-containing protein [Vallicoccus soli]